MRWGGTGVRWSLRIPLYALFATINHIGKVPINNAPIPHCKRAVVGITVPVISNLLDEIKDAPLMPYASAANTEKAIA